MNKNSFFHFRIYTRLSFEDIRNAELLCKKFVDFGGDFVPDRFSANEPILNKFNPFDISEPATILSKTSHHLLLKRLTPQWLTYIYWLKGRIRPWFWTFDFGDKWNKENRPKQIVDFLTSFCEEFQPLLAVGGLSEDWFDKHDVVDPITGEFRKSAGASFNPGSGLPGIYWFNFFGSDLVNYFGRDKFLQLNNILIQKHAYDCVCFLAYDAPDQHNSLWRHERERQIVNELGEQYFFDLSKASGNRPRKRVPIPGVTDAKSLRK